MHHVVIAGGGFAGLYAAKEFKGAAIQVTLVDRRNFHLFQPLLYQVATGGLSPGDIAAPLRWVFRKQRNTRVLLGEVSGIDVAGRKLILENDQAEIHYDSLILATGATHTYFGNTQWERLAPGLKTIEDATEIRQRLLIAFEAAERETDPERRRAWLTFVIAGAGPTGVELAGTLGEIANDTLRHDFRAIRPEQAQILLVDGSDRVLPPYPPALSKEAERALIRLGVRPKLHCHVVAVDDDGVTLRGSDGATQRVASRTVLWAAGVAASGLGKLVAEGTGAPVDKAGRVIVQPDLTVPGHPEIFVAGDLAHVVQPDGTLVPGVAPAAMQMGRYAARVILSRVEGKPAPAAFHYFNKGSLATIGRSAAVADFGKIRFAGFVAWVLWLFVHLMYLVGFENRLLVFLKWSLSYFTFNRGARLITGRTRKLPSFELTNEGIQEPYPKGETVTLPGA